MNNADMPAMPQSVAHGPDGGVVASYDFHGADGLTKREYIAALAMQGFCAATDTDRWAVETLAECAVRQADALLAELERTGGES